MNSAASSENTNRNFNSREAQLLVAFVDLAVDICAHTG